MNLTIITQTPTGRSGIGTVGMPNFVPDDRQSFMPDTVIYYATAATATNPKAENGELVVVDSTSGNTTRIKLARIKSATPREATTAAKKKVQVSVRTGYAAAGRATLVIKPRPKNDGSFNTPEKFFVTFDPASAPTVQALADALVREAAVSTYVDVTRTGTGNASKLVIESKVAGQAFYVETSANLSKPEVLQENVVSSYRAGDFRSAPGSPNLGTDPNKALKAWELEVEVDVPVSGVLGRSSSYASGYETRRAVNTVTVLFDPAGSGVAAAFTAMSNIMIGSGLTATQLGQVTADAEPRNDEQTFEYTVTRTEGAANVTQARTHYSASLTTDFVSLDLAYRDNTLGVTLYNLVTKSGSVPAPAGGMTPPDTVVAGRAGSDDNANL